MVVKYSMFLWYLEHCAIASTFPLSYTVKEEAALTVLFMPFDYLIYISCQEAIEWVYLIKWQVSTCHKAQSWDIFQHIQKMYGIPAWLVMQYQMNSEVITAGYLFIAANLYNPLKHKADME